MNSTFDYLPGLSLHPSDDLVTRRQMGHAIQDPGQFDFKAVPDSRGSSAPTIRCHDGTFFIACALMDAGEVTGNFVVTATDIAAPSRRRRCSRMRELDPERGKRVGEESVIWTRTTARVVWAETPHLYERDGWSYLVTAEGGRRPSTR